jgi:hypothetical protein
MIVQKTNIKTDVFEMFCDWVRGSDGRREAYIGGIVA